MNLLITGGAGYIGSHTARHAAAVGHATVVLDNLSTGHREHVRWSRFVEGCISDAALVRDAIREFAIDAVFHFAASAYVGHSVLDPRAYYRNNVANTLALLDACCESGVRKFVFSSSCATYGNPPSLPIREGDPQVPVNPYGETKLAIEKALNWFSRAGQLRYVALRYFNAAGAHPDGDLREIHDPETHLLPLAIDTALGLRGPLPVYGLDYPTPDGSAVRDYVHVMDLAAAHAAALEYLEAGGESVCLNLGTARGVSVLEAIAAVERVTGRPVSHTPLERRAGDPPILVADPALAFRILGWRPRFTAVDEIVATAVRALRRSREAAATA